jgi:collagenase-like PrtC family protease
MLPAPKFMTMSNSNTVVDNTKAYVQNLTEVFGYDLDDTEKAEFINLAMRHFLSSHVDTNAIDELKSLAKLNVAVKSTGQEEG